MESLFFLVSSLNCIVLFPLKKISMWLIPHLSFVNHYNSWILQENQFTSKFYTMYLIRIFVVLRLNWIWTVYENIQICHFETIINRIFKLNTKRLHILSLTHGIPFDGMLIIEPFIWPLMSATWLWRTKQIKYPVSRPRKI